MILTAVLPRIVAKHGSTTTTTTALLRMRSSKALLMTRSVTSRCPSSYYFSTSSPSAAADHTTTTTTTTTEEDVESYGLYGLLNETERQYLYEQREITKLSQSLASRVGISDTAVVLKTSQSKSLLLDELSTFSVVIAGEFNAGKSTLINALLGKKLLQSGALPTTDSITIVSHASNNNDNNNNVKIPMGVTMYTSEDLPLLKDLTLVDTPGTNSAWMDHTERTLNLLPAADLILFITSADRPFSESEKALLTQIQAYRKNIVVVVNKMDILDTAGGDHGKEQKEAIVEFVTDHASELLGARPIVLAVSSRDALSAKLFEKPSASASSSDSDEQQQQQRAVRSNVWHRSNFESLETFLQTTLTTEAKLKSKLVNPIGVAEGVVAHCLDALKEQRNDLEADIATLHILESQFEGWKKELSSDLSMSRQNMSEMVRQEGDRSDILLGRLNVFQFHSWALWNTRRLEQEWEETKRQASAHRQQKSLETDLLEQVQETADSIATRGRAQGQAVIEYLGKRPSMKHQSLVGSVTAASRFEETRQVLSERLSSAVTDCLRSTTNTNTTGNNNNNSNDNEIVERAHFFFQLKQTALLSAVLQTGAVGSIVLSTLTQVVVNPMEGLFAAAACALSGGATYVAGTSMISKSYRKDWIQRAELLDKTLDVICNKELERVNRKILDGVAPYTRFVESEKERIEQLRDECETVIAGARSLRNKVNNR